MNKYFDGLMGFAIGDAMGLPLEKKPREELLKKPITKMIGNGTYLEPAGTWSDDTSLMIATIDSINNKNTIDLNHMALNYVAYKNHNLFTPYNETFGLSPTCMKAIDNYDEERENPTKCGLSDVTTNGSLKRVLPLAYYANERHLNDIETRQLVIDVSSITHASNICLLGCYFYVRLAMFLLNGKDKYSAYSMAKSVDYTMFGEEANDAFSRLLKDDISKYDLKDIKSTPHIVDTLEAVVWVLLKSNSYKEAIIGAINLGESTDTIAALVGGLTGIIYTYESIPEDWLNTIVKKDYLLDIFEEFSENKYE